MTPETKLAKEAKLRSIYWTDGPWCDWVRELNNIVEAQAAESEAQEQTND